MAKKFLATLLSFLLIVGMGNFAVLADGVVVLEEGFDDEASIKAWQNDSNYGNLPVVDQEVKADGGGSALFGDDGQPHSMYKRITGLEANTTYAVSFYVRAEGTHDFYVALSPSSWASSSSWYTFSWITKATEVFSYHSFSYTTPADGSVTDLCLILKTTNLSTGKIWIDDLSFGEKESLLQNAGFEVASSVSGTDNLWADLWVCDGKYQENADTAETGNICVVASDEARTGRYSLKLRTDALNGNGVVRQTVTGLEGGATYEVSAWIKTTGERASGAMGAGIMAGNNAWDGVSNYWSKFGTKWHGTTTDGKWEKITTYFVVPSDKTAAVIMLVGQAGTGGTYTTYFDDVILKKFEGASIELSDANGNSIVNLKTEEDTIVRVTASAVNVSKTEKKPLCILYGIYKSTINGMQLKDMQILHLGDMDVATDVAYACYRAKTDITVPKGCSLKVMALNGIETLMPLSKVIKLS